MNDLAYINGGFIALEEATVSIRDRGFQFGDSIYEVIKLYNGKLFKLEEHLQRLLESAQQIRLDLEYSISDLKELANQILAKNQSSSRRKEGGLYIQITRGTAPRSYDFANDLDLTIIMYLLPDILTSQQAKDKGADEGIFVTENGIITEGTSSNLFIVKNNQLYTHPDDGEILPGITRELVLDLAADKFDVKEEKFDLESLYQADEVFITNTPKEVLGVIKINDQKIAEGQVGEITKKIHKLYKKHIEELKK